jgi:cell division protein FtsB
MTKRRRRDGERKDLGPGAGGSSQPRVQGAWDTPAVVVRAPDGSIVPPGWKPTRTANPAGTTRPARPGRPGDPPTRPAGDADAERAAGVDAGAGGSSGEAAGGPGPEQSAVADAGAGGSTGEGGDSAAGPSTEGAARPTEGAPERARGTGGGESARDGGGLPRPRVRPRRIPGATGAVLAVPTLRPDAADGRMERRRRRLAAPSASVTVLPPRPGDEGGEDPERGASLPLRPVGPAKGHVPGRGARRPMPRRPGEPRTQRVLQAVAAINRNLNLDRLLPADEEARQRRLARLRRVGMRVASLTLAAMLLYAVFPVRTYLNQRAATERAREQIDVLSEENDRLEQRAEDLRDPETVEEIARRELGLVMPGEESYGIFPAPEEPATTTTIPSG